MAVEFGGIKLVGFTQMDTSVARRSNPLTVILVDHLKQLDELQYQSFLHQSTTDKTIAAYRRSLDHSETTKEGDDAVVFGLSSRLAVQVLVGRPRHIYPVLGYGAVDEQHIAVVREIDQRVQAQLLGLAFETMESFFRGFMGRLFFLTRSENPKGRIPLKHQRSEFLKYLQGKNHLQKNTPQYFEQYAAWYGRRNCDELLKDLRAACPEFDASGQKNRSRTNLFDFYRTVAVCRHLTVHAAGILEKSQLKRLPLEWRNLLCTEVIRTSQITKKDTLLPNQPFVHWAIERSASFMHLAYSIVSNELNLEIGPSL